MIRRYGESPKEGRRYVIRPGTYAVLPKGDRLLATFQDAPKPELQLPGGGIDAGEAPLAALHREVLEETGWTIAGPRRLGAFRRFTFMPDYGIWAEKICHVYLATPALRRGDPFERSHTAVWLPLERAGEMLGNLGDRTFAAAIMRRVR